MSILVHPDKNQDDSERAQKAFDGEKFTVCSAYCSSTSCIIIEHSPFNSGMFVVDWVTFVATKVE